jgi:hypothetical protein
VHYCQPSDGGGECYKKRRCELTVQAARKRASRAKKVCAHPDCNNYVKDVTKECCSHACGRDLVLIRAQEAEIRFMSGHLEWPYKLPMDPAVTPSMMNPMG